MALKRWIVTEISWKTKLYLHSTFVANDRINVIAIRININIILIALGSKDPEG